jgi:hypothetical protein
MEKQEKKLANLFQQMGNKRNEKLEMPDLRLKDAVFSTIDATNLIADILDLFTVKLVQTQSEMLDSLPGSDYGLREEEKLFKYFEKKRSENLPPTEGGY